MADLMPEVGEFEPHLALRGGDEDGLAAYRSLAVGASRLLHPGGWLLVEVGIGQADVVCQLFAQAGLGELFVRDDYAGVPRVVGGRNSA
jgi:release factor glutamine methyltransferase